MIVNCFLSNIKKGKELRVPHHASAAATRDGNLPHVTATCLTRWQLAFIPNSFACRGLVLYITIPTVNLPGSNRFINIIVVVNYFIKMRYIIPIDLINTILVAKYFIKYVFKLYRLPNIIVGIYSFHVLRAYARDLHETRICINTALE